MYQRLKMLINEYKILRGMLSYATLWPIGNLLEQTLVEKRNFQTYDYAKCLRISMHGALYMGPTMFLWMRFASKMFPGRSLSASVSKALCEQLAYDPSAIVVFLFVMTIADGGTLADAREEVRAKFFDTFRVGAVYWPCVQTANFTFIPVKNQVVCTSLFSMIWSSFLAYMKHLELNEDNESTSTTISTVPTK